MIRLNSAKVDERDVIGIVGEQLRRVIGIHFDPKHGSRFWLERADSLGIDAKREIQKFDDLALLGDMTPSMLQGRPLTDFIPQRFHSQLDHFVVCQTGGTTGVGAWTAYRQDEFEQAFVLPFVAAANALDFPRGEPWLYIGPSGPHVIGKAARRLATSMGAADPFSVDFDPRWAKRLPEASLALNRYLEHVIEQAMEILQTQRIGVLFTTPVILNRLSQTMSDAQCSAIRAVRYGGMALDSETLLRLQNQSFPNALHLSGYGNTFFGCCLELDVSPGRCLNYFPFGPRLVLEVVDDQGHPLPCGRLGRVRFTRLDESMLIVRMLERDEAELIRPVPNAPAGFTLPGVRDPHSSLKFVPQQRTGLY